MSRIKLRFPPQENWVNECYQPIENREGRGTVGRRRKSVVLEIVKERLSGDCHKKVGSGIGESRTKI